MVSLILFYSLVLSSFRIYIIIIVLMETVPRERIIVGPLNRAGIHFCLSSRLWHGFQTPNPLEINDGDAPECIEYCVLQDEV